jgi:DNA-directed RNA polymerase sigma subunit (sigma70/sigma32)
MFNPDFWEVRLDPCDLDRFSNEACMWYETHEDTQSRLQRDQQTRLAMEPIMEMITGALTPRQREVVILYYLHVKTQEEIAQIMGISRRVVSQHLFGICRNGRHVGGAMNKIRKLCRQHGLMANGTARPTQNQRFRERHQLHGASAPV